MSEAAKHHYKALRVQEINTLDKSMEILQALKNRYIEAYKELLMCDELETQLATVEYSQTQRIHMEKEIEKLETAVRMYISPIYELLTGNTPAQMIGALRSRAFAEAKGELHTEKIKYSTLTDN